MTRAPLPPRSPNLHAYAERRVGPVKEECLSRLILFREAPPRHALTQYVEHFQHERNHQGKGPGSRLLWDALNRSEERSRDIGSVAVIVDAKDEPAARFYEKFGFRTTQFTKDGFGPGIDECKMRKEFS